MTADAPYEANSAGFSTLALSDWRQFGDISLAFHPRLTVLTGANATGKSTILGILARHFDWIHPFSTSPVRTRSKSGEWISVGRRRAKRMSRQPGWAEVGTLTYRSDKSTAIAVPLEVQANLSSQYDLLMPDQQEVAGAFISSHRAASGSYSPVQSIPTAAANADLLFDSLTNEIRARWAGTWTGKTPQLVLKESIMAAAVFGSGPGHDSLSYNPTIHNLWTEFGVVLRTVLPASLRFRRIVVRTPDVVLETDSGDFVLDEASGGIMSIIEMAWQILLRSHGSSATFTVLLDEPENHLHPSLQREMLPSFLRAFPQVQFIVATHSPFVVTATPASTVYALDYNERQQVVSRVLDYSNKAASAEETLKNVLGLHSTAPTWAESAYQTILARYAGELSPQRLSLLREEMTQIGLVKNFPEAVVDLAHPENLES
ncbi:AAA family ATPase [Aeromicrobium yanjiei]|uniref:AAA family ATPase n=1 Tax=Aeromicrobium yanjiei TaxID=2662028 RepID=A0A5Q2MJ13_9ACTN|nr:AAA family ATPase [Aeromicrobium yanjiei]QGG41046.1 AAA family ATPase [Aeromicrobium yanjiei]